MNSAYVRAQLLIALRVARFEKGAVHEFDHSLDGFFRSFFGIVLCAPLYTLVLYAERRIVANAPLETPDVLFSPLPAVNFAFLTMETLTYLAHWIAFPVAMIYLTRLLGAQERYVPFIVAFNWTSCVALTLTTLPSLLYLIGAASILGANAISFPIVMFAVAYHWLVARETLAI
nr:MAG: hypothetical protein E4H34_04825 [Hyphomicrobiales bacterium]